MGVFCRNGELTRKGPNPLQRTGGERGASNVVGMVDYLWRFRPLAAELGPLGSRPEDREMKRDLEFVRKMVPAIEDSSGGWAPDLAFDGYTEEQIGYHAYLIIDAGLARVQDVSTMGSAAPQGLITSLTWAGHEFADAARDEIRWNKAMAVVHEKCGAVPIDVLTQLLVALMKGAFGLP